MGQADAGQPGQVWIFVAEGRFRGDPTKGKVDFNWVEIGAAEAFKCPELLLKNCGTCLNSRKILSPNVREHTRCIFNR